MAMDSADEMFERYFAASKDKRPRKRKVTGARKNAIRKEELLLYRKAVEKRGNDWKQILAYFVKNKEMLESNIALKYVQAFNDIGNKLAVKPIRNRLGNIARRVRNSLEVHGRETRNVVMSNNPTAEEVVLKMKKIKEKEATDPVNVCDESESDDDIQAARDDLISTITVEDQVEQTERGGRQLSLSELEEDEETVPLPSKDEEKKKKKTGERRNKRRATASAEKLGKLTARAEQLLDVGMQAARMHVKFLKQSAKSQGLELSSDTEDSNE